MTQRTPRSSVLMSDKVREEHYRRHLERLESVKSQLNNSPPSQHSHLMHRRKFIQNQDSRFARIHRENQTIEKRLEKIYSGKEFKPINTFNSSYSKPRINHKHETRQRQYAKTHAENVLLEERLWNTRSHFSTDEWENDFKRHQRILCLRASLSNNSHSSALTSRNTSRCDA